MCVREREGKNKNLFIFILNLFVLIQILQNKKLNKYQGTISLWPKRSRIIDTGKLIRIKEFI